VHLAANSPKFHLLQKMLHILEFYILAFFCCTSVYGDASWRGQNRWVDSWTSMPQLVEPANLPPAPYVSFKNSSFYVKE